MRSISTSADSGTSLTGESLTVDMLQKKTQNIIISSATSCKILVIINEKGKVKSVHEPTYPGFCSMKQLGVFLLPPGWEGYPQH